MKIGVSSYSLRKHAAATKCSYVDLCNIAKEMGFEGIEFVNLDNKDYTMGTDDIFACAEKIRKHCEAIGLEILAYTVDGNLLAENIDAEIEKLKKCVDVAEALGAPVMRHDACSRLPNVPRANWKSGWQMRRISPKCTTKTTITVKMWSWRCSTKLRRMHWSRTQPR